MNSFYVLGENRFDRCFAYSQPEDSAIYDGYAHENICPKCGIAIGGLIWKRPHNIWLSSRKIGDFIFGLVAPFLVSDKVKTIMIEDGITGILRFDKIDRMRYGKTILMTHIGR